MWIGMRAPCRVHEYSERLTNIFPPLFREPSDQRDCGAQPQFFGYVDNFLGTLRIEMFIDDLLHSSGACLYTKKNATTSTSHHQIKEWLPPPNRRARAR